ncbi:cell division protein FtsW [Aurantimicrobium minutum]|uniref:peptidoglycan glycosyltransferase FtsW n=1 Tax=Aurantimicrobium minutum TaxID=708131 RepID=UPI0024755333|nr:putative peptidoglycan glycosyltransferase FtsW [Aurantimicrobium minutum]MDH6278013.1 cell division protein FtsW [Aurantimicrobium minutum]
MATPPRTNNTRRPASAPRSSAPGSPGRTTGRAAQPSSSSASRSGGLATRFQLGTAFRAESPNFYLLAGVTLFTVILGLIMVLSASAVDSFLQSGGFFVGFLTQAGAAVIALPVMLGISRLPLVFYRKWANIALYSTIGLQLLVFTPLGVESGGNRNWLDIGVQFQPSEMIKLTIAVWLGVNLPLIIKRVGPYSYRIFSALIPVYAALVVVLAGQDLGTAIIIFAIIVACLAFSGVATRMIVWPMIAGAAGVIVLAIISPNRMARILSFLNENCTDYTNACWQPLHGKWALANGGVFGVGLGQSKAKWSWLPAADNDYIFAIIGEELGMIGCLVVIGLFVTLAVAFIRIIRMANDPLVRIVTGGIMIWIVGQAFVNIGVVLGVLPVLGVPLPLLSSGGSALIMSLLAIGVVLSFTKEEKPVKRQRSRPQPRPQARARQTQQARTR